MAQFLEFAGNHWILFVALVVVICAIIVNEVILLLLRGQLLDPEHATRLFNQDRAVFVDLRGENAYLSAHLPEAVNLPLPQLEQKMDKLKQYSDRSVILYHDSEFQARKFGLKLKRRGMENIYHLRGGISAWQRAGLPTKSK